MKNHDYPNNLQLYYIINTNHKLRKSDEFILNSKFINMLENSFTVIIEYQIQKMFGYQHNKYIINLNLIIL